MPPVPQGYPFATSDADLKATLGGMMDPASWPGFDDFGRLLPELKLALLAAGIQEQARRESAATSARSIRIAYAALGVAAVTLVVSVVIAFAT